MNSVNRIISLDRDDMTELEKQLFIKDLSKINDEYFECNGDATLEVTRADGGFLVCVIFTARRIKSVRSPQ